MVRFSDIIKTKGKQDDRKKQPEPVREEEWFRFSDSHLFKSRNSDIEPPDTEPEKPKRKVSDFEITGYYKSLLKRAQETGRAVKDNKPVVPSAVLADLHGIVERDLAEPLYEYAMKQKPDDDLCVHTVNVVLTSLTIGSGLKYDIKMMLRLGLAAFYENIGTYKIPERILASSETLSDHEMKVIKEHSETAFDSLLSLGERYRWLAETARSIHERSDGSGYPDGIKGDEIPELASVIGISDMYCAMISDRPYRKRIKRTDAVNYITGEGKDKFPSKIVKTFIKEISLIPVNTVVKLNTGVIARVISVNRKHPLNPTVETVYGSSGSKPGKEQIDLANNPLLYIAEVIDDPEDL